MSSNIWLSPRIYWPNHIEFYLQILCKQEHEHVRSLSTIEILFNFNQLHQIYRTYSTNRSAVSEWCFTSLSTVFQSYCDGVCLWQILRVLPHSAASLEYRAANDPNTDTPPSHIILTPGAPSEEASSTNFYVFGLTRPGIEPTTSRLRGRRSNH